MHTCTWAHAFQRVLQKIVFWGHFLKTELIFHQLLKRQKSFKQWHSDYTAFEKTLYMPYSLSLACSNVQYVICTCGVILCYGDLSKERDRTVHVVLTCIIESQNTLGWKGPQKSSISNTPTPLIQVHCSLFTIITHFVTLLRPEIWDVWLVLVSFLNWALSPALICLRIL